MSSAPDTHVAIEALAALEMDQLERAVKLAGTAAATALFEKALRAAQRHH